MKYTDSERAAGLASALRCILTRTRGSSEGHMAEQALEEYNKPED